MEKKLKRDVPLAQHTTFRIGGPALYYIEPESLSEFRDSITWALRSETPFFVLGGGSNILVHDTGFKGFVINTKHLNRIEVKGSRIICECGVLIDTLVNITLQHRLAGMEFAAGLPGTVGGALFMNARAYDGAISGIVEEVLVLKRKKKGVDEVYMKKDDLQFAYKHSIFQKNDVYLCKAFFKLTPGTVHTIQAKIDENRENRREKGQYLYPNAGCIFKNDYKTGVPSGKIIEDLGLKGKRIGGAEVYAKHANFIVNRGNATAEDVFQLILFIEKEVREKKGVVLEREINLIGNWSDSQLLRLEV
jgi:UDP-N-acetylmuramate dehydrogenase